MQHMEIDPRAALRLFQAIVTQALVDACAPEPTVSSAPIKRRKGEDDISYARRSAEKEIKRKDKAHADRRDAREWLTGDGESFNEICSLAGYEPVSISERAKRLAIRGWVAKGYAIAA